MAAQDTSCMTRRSHLLPAHRSHRDAMQLLLAWRKPPPRCSQHADVHACMPRRGPAELGIDIGAILVKARSLLFFRMNNRHLEDLDMGGALVLIFSLAGLHLLVRVRTHC